VLSTVCRRSTVCSHRMYNSQAVCERNRWHHHPNHHQHQSRQRGRKGKSERVGRDYFGQHLGALLIIIHTSLSLSHGLCACWLFHTTISYGNPFTNFHLIGAMCISFGLHFVILYVPTFASIFCVEPIDLNEWLCVLVLAFPVILIDECMKLFIRIYGMCKSPQQ
jgi:magnesium-transporting ATPase (P-type)